MILLILRLCVKFRRIIGAIKLVCFVQFIQFLHGLCQRFTRIRFIFNSILPYLDSFGHNLAKIKVLKGIIHV